MCRPRARGDRRDRASPARPSPPTRGSVPRAGRRCGRRSRRPGFPSARRRRGCAASSRRRGRSRRAAAPRRRAAWGSDRRRSASPTRSRASRARAAARASPWSSSGTWTFSSAVSVGMSWKLWKTKPTFSPRSRARASSVRAVRSAPSRSTEPALGVSRPASRPSSVVLPLPDGPTIATKAPVGNVERHVAEHGELVRRRCDIPSSGLERRA